MKILLPFLVLCVLSFGSYAAIYADKPAPVLHSIFDGRLETPAVLLIRQTAQQQEPFFDPRSKPAPSHHKAAPGATAAAVGGGFLAMGLLAYIGAKATYDSSFGHENTTSGMLALLALVCFVIGGILFLTGLIIGVSHPKKHATLQ